MEEWEESLMEKYGIRVKVNPNLSLTWGPEEVSYLIMRAAKATISPCPMGLAAAACCIAAVLTSNKIPLRKISRITHVEEETIRNRSNDLLSNLLITIAL